MKGATLAASDPGSVMEYLDLSPYDYRSFPLPMRSIGWLGQTYGVQNSGAPRAPHASAGDLRILRAASQRLGSIMLGTHECEFCPEDAPFEGNGEYRYYIPGGEVFSAPMMVLHYVEEHGYSPPEEFLSHLREPGTLTWDGRAELLAEIVLDQSSDPDFRCEAIIDLAKWPDPRAARALHRVAHDEELVDVAGDEIGRSLGILLRRGVVDVIAPDHYSDMVRFGIGEILRSRG